MLRVLKSLPFAFEFVAVLTVAFGLFVFASLQAAFRAVPLHYDSVRLIHLLVIELLLLALLLPFMSIRGWTFQKIGLRPTLKDTGFGVLLFMASYAAWALVLYVTYIVSPSTIRAMMAARVFTMHFPPLIAVAVGLVNPFFEEIFVAGYLMTALDREERPWLAIHASVALRVLYHLYQGVKGVLSIIPLGLIFGFWYARTGRLWPLVVAHALADLLALLLAGYI